MKVLIVNQTDTVGGAARAAHRLHRALLNENIESHMLVRSKTSDECAISGTYSTMEKVFALIGPTFDEFPLRKYRNKAKPLFSPAWFGSYKIVEKINKFQPDIVHLHWICGSMLPIQWISKINAPIVWSLHDMWAFTGGCHYDNGCGAYKESCGNCKLLRSCKNVDLSRKVFNKKNAVFSRTSSMTIIGLSKWITECAKGSPLLRGRNVVNLPNPLDSSIFKPVDKNMARNLLRLPEDKKLILFGAMKPTDDLRKGFAELCGALKAIKSKNIDLVVFGSSVPKDLQDFGFTTHYLGKFHDDISLVALYNAADIMVVPSLQENLSNAIMESLACGTPVVGFDIGGNSDMIDHRKNGYLATPFEINDLAAGIDWVLDNESYSYLSINAREKVIREFDSAIVAKRYIALYEEILKQ